MMLRSAFLACLDSIIALAQHVLCQSLVALPARCYYGANRPFMSYVVGGGTAEAYSDADPDLQKPIMLGQVLMQPDRCLGKG